jgi:hypothetical protein
MLNHYKTARSGCTAQPIWRRCSWPISSSRPERSIVDGATVDEAGNYWLTVPFNGNAAALEQSSPTLRLAASASAFSEWLVASPFAAEVTPDRLLSLMSGMPEIFGVDQRPRQLEAMIRQAKSLAGK